MHNFGSKFLLLGGASRFPCVIPTTVIKLVVEAWITTKRRNSMKRCQHFVCLVGFFSHRAHQIYWYNPDSKPLDSGWPFHSFLDPCTRCLVVTRDIHRGWRSWVRGRTGSRFFSTMGFHRRVHTICCTLFTMVLSAVGYASVSWYMPFTKAYSRGADSAY